MNRTRRPEAVHERAVSRARGCYPMALDARSSREQVPQIDLLHWSPPTTTRPDRLVLRWITRFAESTRQDHDVTWQDIAQWTVAALFIAAVLVFMITAFGCSSGMFDSCSPGEMRCDGNRSQMCDSNNQWTTWQNCGSIGETCYKSTEACSGYSGIACCR